MVKLVTLLFLYSSYLVSQTMALSLRADSPAVVLLSFILSVNVFLDIDVNIFFMKGYIKCKVEEQVEHEC